MKILLGVPEYPPHHVGGGGEVYKALAENYKKLGHDVVVVSGYYPTSSWSEDIKEYVDANGIKFYQIPEIPYPKSKPFLRTVMPPNLKVLNKIKMVLKKEKPDVAHLHGYGFFFIYLLYKYLRRQNVEYIFTIHGYPETQNSSGFLIRYIWKIFERIFVQPVMRHAKKVTCVSNYIKEDKRNISKLNSVVIYNGINTEDYKYVKHDINIRDLYNINPSTTVILSLGRIAKMKGFQEVIERLPDYKERTKRSVVYLIGGQDDGYKGSLDVLVQTLGLEENVKFVGFLDLETKKQYIDQCDVFAVPSLWEPFGLVALEGMIYNKPILTTNGGALKEILEGYSKKVVLYQADFADQVEQQKSVKAVFDPSRFDYKIIAEDYLQNLKA